MTIKFTPEQYQKAMELAEQGNYGIFNDTMSEYATFRLKHGEDKEINVTISINKELDKATIEVLEQDYLSYSYPFDVYQARMIISEARENYKYLALLEHAIDKVFS